MRSIHTEEHVFRKVSEIDCPVDKVWERVTTQEGINDEMGPYMKMTMPKQFRGKSIADVTPGTRIGRASCSSSGCFRSGSTTSRWRGSNPAGCSGRSR